jgi:hypothetical protein
VEWLQSGGAQGSSVSAPGGRPARKAGPAARLAAIGSAAAVLLDVPSSEIHRLPDRNERIAGV